MLEEVIKDLRGYSSLYRQEIDEKRANGEYFNLISIMRMEANEEKTHSNIIAELLNPNGLHSKGDVFLTKFLDQVNINSLDTSKTKVYTEYFVGDLEYVDGRVGNVGGRIDIYITDGDNHIAIENKIYANDQPRQLVRYNNFLQQQTNERDKIHLLYLNLDGTAPSTESIKPEGEGKTLNEKDDYEIIEYKKHIRSWLKHCIDTTDESQYLHHNLRQYNAVLEKLTNTYSSIHMNKIKEIAKNNIDVVACLFSNFNSIDSLLQYSLQDFCNLIRKELRDKNNKDNGLSNLSAEDLYYATNNGKKGLWIKYKEDWLFFGEGDYFYIEYNSSKLWKYTTEINFKANSILKYLTFDITNLTEESKLFSIAKNPSENIDLVKAITDLILEFITLDNKELI